jgi:hypothetical protein
MSSGIINANSHGHLADLVTIIGGFLTRTGGRAHIRVHVHMASTHTYAYNLKRGIGMQLYFKGKNVGDICLCSFNSCIFFPIYIYFIFQIAECHNQRRRKFKLSRCCGQIKSIYCIYF